MSRTRLLGISDKHPRTIEQMGDAPKFYVVYVGDFGDGKLWRTFGPEGGCTTKEEAELVKDDVQFLMDSWNSLAS